MTTLTLAALLLPSAPPETAEPPAAVVAAAAATVRVTDPSTAAVGSGVVVAVRDESVYVLTAAHVVGPDGRPTVEAFAGRPAKAAAARDRGDVLFRDTGRDLAVVRVPAGKFEWRVAKLAPADTTLAQAWAAGCAEGAAPELVRAGAAKQKLVRSGDGSAFFWETKGATTAGRSGGPLLDGDGRLAGICSGTQEGMTYFAHSNEIRAALRAHRLEWVAGAGGK